MKAEAVERQAQFTCSTAHLASILWRDEDVLGDDGKPMTEDAFRKVLQQLVRELRTWAAPQRENCVLHPALARAVRAALS